MHRLRQILEADDLDVLLQEKEAKQEFAKHFERVMMAIEKLQTVKVPSWPDPNPRTTLQ